MNNRAAGTETSEFEPGISSERRKEIEDEVATLAARPFVAWLRKRAAEVPSDVAFRHKDLGIWQECTWSQYLRRVRLTALGLLELGLAPRETLAIMGDPAPEWLYADLATQSLGAITFGLYVTTPAPDVKYLMEDSGARIFIAEDQEYVDRLLESEAEVDHIIVMDTRGMFAYQDERIISFDRLQQLGASRADRDSAEWEKLADQCSPDAPITIFYTSGTTGRPKGGVVSSRNLVTSWAAGFSIWQPPTSRDRIVSYLPLAHVAERMMTVYLPLLFRAIPFIPEDADSIESSMREASPTLLIGFPRSWETYASQVVVDIEVSDWLKRSAYQTAMHYRRRLLEHRWAGTRPSVHVRVLALLSYWAVCRPILDRFGYGRLRLVFTGGAPVSPDVIRLWQIWGVQVMEIYGMTECGGFATVQTGLLPRPGVAGRPLPGVEMRLDQDGEILLRGENVFLGYWKRPEATSEATDEDGWLLTGDIGEILADGNLRVIDRKSDLLRTLDGAIIAASELEHILKFSPYIRDAMLVGHQKPYLTALVEIDFDNAAEWARSHQISYTGFTNLAQNPHVRQLLEDEVNQANATMQKRDLPAVQDFRVLPKELEPEAGDEVTATRKVKRRHLASKFSDLVLEMYESDEAQAIAGHIG